MHGDLSVFPLDRVETEVSAITLSQPHDLRVLQPGIGERRICQFCGARRFAEEVGAKQWCCQQGKCVLEPLKPYPDALHNLLYPYRHQGREYNNFFAIGAVGYKSDRVVGSGVQNKNMWGVFTIVGRPYVRIFDCGYDAPHHNINLCVDGGREKGNGRLNMHAVQSIDDCLRLCNVFYQHFRHLGSIPSTPNLRIVYDSRANRAEHGNRAGKVHYLTMSFTV